MNEHRSETFSVLYMALEYHIMALAYFLFINFFRGTKSSNDQAFIFWKIMYF